MKGAEYKLFKEIEKVSDATNWNDIKKEWALVGVYEAEEPSTCLCGKYPIIEICVLKNINNGSIVEVGNSCVNKFLGIDSDSVTRGVKKIKKDILSSVPEKLITKSYQENIINKWENDFYLNIFKKRNLSSKQEKVKIKINNKILDRYSKKSKTN